jgi:hypothetical protein
MQSQPTEGARNEPRRAARAGVRRRTHGRQHTPGFLRYSPTMNEARSTPRREPDHDAPQPRRATLRKALPPTDNWNVPSCLRPCAGMSPERLMSRRCVAGVGRADCRRGVGRAVANSGRSFSACSRSDASSAGARKHSPFVTSRSGSTSSTGSSQAAHSATSLPSQARSSKFTPHRLSTVIRASSARSAHTRRSSRPIGIREQAP